MNNPLSQGKIRKFLFLKNPNLAAFNPRILRVNKSKNRIETWFENSSFEGEGFNLNGITYVDNAIYTVKMNSGELFGAYKEAGGKMENFKEGLDNLLKIGKIKSDSDGNIMTLENFDRDKSQKDDVKADDDEKSDRRKEEDTKIESSRTGGENDLESIIELKNETDSWLIEQLKNKNQTEGDANLKKEVDELRDRVQKLEKIIKNLTKAFE